MKRDRTLSTHLRLVPIRELLDFAKAYASLGDAVGEQVQGLIDGAFSDLNENAVDLIRKRLGGVNQELDEWLRAFAFNRS